MTSLLASQRDGILRLTLNRPAVHNALNPELVQRLSQALEEADSRDGIRAVVLAGSGDEAFCSGADVKELAALNDGELARFLSTASRLFRRLATLGKPTVAALCGHAHGGGAELACACDLRIGCPETTFRFPGVAYGLAVGTWQLPALIGVAKAKELLLTARTVQAQEALDIGLLNEVVAREKVLARAEDLARQAIRHAANALAAVKYLINGVSTSDDRPFLDELDANLKPEALERFRSALNRSRTDS